MYDIDIKSTSFKPDLKDIPANVDWRKKGAVTDVQNQGKCGSNEEMVFLDSASSYNAIQTGKLVVYSLDQIGACCSNNTGGACTGGFSRASINCVKMKGLCPEKFNPCHGGVSPCTCHCNGPVLKIQDVKNVISGDETALAAAVAKQPVMVLIDAGHSSFLVSAYHNNLHSYNSIYSCIIQAFMNHLIVQIQDWIIRYW